MGDRQKLKVFGLWGSPFSRRVELVLKLKGAPYEYIEEDVYVNKSPLLLKYNPVHKKVPVLLHNGKPIAESLLIVEYIDETWKANSLLPEDPYEKAVALFWAKYIDDKVTTITIGVFGYGPITFLIFSFHATSYFYVRCIPALWKACWAVEEERKKVVEEALECPEVLENELKVKGTLFFGEIRLDW